MEWKKFYKESKIDYTSTWLITYSDMITIVLCFFIVFFTFSAEENAILENIKTSLESENESLLEEKKSLMEMLFRESKQGEDFFNYLEKNNLRDSINLVEEERGVSIRFRDNILFSSGRADISKEGELVLREIGKLVQNIDNQIIVEGYTDNIPSNTEKYPSNWELSVARSIGVAKYLIGEMNIDENRLAVSGYGEGRPIDSNESQEGRQNNRRIEIIILN